MRNFCENFHKLEPEAGALPLNYWKRNVCHGTIGQVMLPKDIFAMELLVKKH